MSSQASLEKSGNFSDFSCFSMTLTVLFLFVILFFFFF